MWLLDALMMCARSFSQVLSTGNASPLSGRECVRVRLFVSVAAVYKTRIGFIPSRWFCWFEERFVGRSGLHLFFALI